MTIKRSWWAGLIGEEAYDLASEELTREAAIYTASELLAPGERFQVIEAALSDDSRYEGAEVVPFVHARNYEVVTVTGPANEN